MYVSAYLLKLDVSDWKEQMQQVGDWATTHCSLDLILIIGGVWVKEEEEEEEKEKKVKELEEEGEEETCFADLIVMC